MYDIENYYEAKSVEDAVAHLAADEKAEVIAGGTDVLVKLRAGKDAGCDLVSIHEIPELKGVDRLTDGTIVIGPATCFTDITNDPIIRESLPYLGEAVDTVGGPQIRNMGTIGGNLCNGATSADSGATMQTLNATLVLQGPEGSREVPVTEFYTGPGKTVRRRDEVLIAILVKPEDYIGYSGCYIKYGKRRSMEIATLGCCVRVKLEAAGAERAEAEEPDGIQGSSATRREEAAGSPVLPGDGFRLADVRIGYGVAAPTPQPLLTEVRFSRFLRVSRRLSLGSTASSFSSPLTVIWTISSMILTTFPAAYVFTAIRGASRICCALYLCLIHRLFFSEFNRREVSCSGGSFSDASEDGLLKGAFCHLPDELNTEFL